MPSLCRRVAVLQEVVRHLRKSSHLTRALKVKNQEVEYQAVILEDEGGKLQATDEAECVRVSHIYRVTRKDQQPQIDRYGKPLYVKTIDAKICLSIMRRI